LSALAAAAAWLQPRSSSHSRSAVAAGAPDAPWLRARRAGGPAGRAAGGRAAAGAQPVTAVVAAVTSRSWLAADLLVVADAATLLGAPRWQGAALAALAALALAAWPRACRLSPPALAVAAVALLLGPAAVALALGAPWTAWHRSGARPALTFSERSPWVLGGERFARATTLRFAEGQRVVDAGGPASIAWSSAMRRRRPCASGADGGRCAHAPPGRRAERRGRARTCASRLGAGAGRAGVRRRVGRRARARPRLLPVALGALVTMLGGALALVPPARRGRAAAAGPLVLARGDDRRARMGVYAAGVPDLVLGGALPAPLLRLPTAALGARAGVPLALLTAARCSCCWPPPPWRCASAWPPRPRPRRSCGPASWWRRRRSRSGPSIPGVCSRWRSAWPRQPGRRLAWRRRRWAPWRVRCGVAWRSCPGGAARAGAGRAGVARGAGPVSGARRAAARLAAARAMPPDGERVAPGG